jgi:hypothetical protein
MGPNLAELREAVKKMEGVPDQMQSLVDGLKDLSEKLDKLGTLMNEQNDILRNQ